MKKVAIYARVSTLDQDPELQLRELRDYVQRHPDYELYDEFIDHASGSKDSRPAFDKLKSDIHKRKFDVLLVWKFDRLARSTKMLVDVLDQLQSKSMDFISYTQNIDTSTPLGKAMFTMIAAFAEFEKSLIVERVKSGMANAKAKGIQLGRPSVGDGTKLKVKIMRQSGLSIRKIANELQLSVGIVHKLAVQHFIPDLP
jgi:DNA invertase Pin-like site-specific DNA recombinase